MELVYLWVEEYKNIKKQGFNFSPRFNVDFNPGSNDYEIKMCCKEKKEKLSIKNSTHPIFTKKKNYQKIDFLPSNINISAIVGANGSGKTAILHQLLNISDLETVKKTKLYAFDEKSNKVKFIDFNTLHKKETQVLLLEQDNESASYGNGYSVNHFINIEDYKKRNNAVIAFLGQNKSSHIIKDSNFFPMYFEFKLIPNIEVDLSNLVGLKIVKTDNLYGEKIDSLITNNDIDNLNNFLNKKITEAIKEFKENKNIKKYMYLRSFIINLFKNTKKSFNIFEQLFYAKFNLDFPFFKILEENLYSKEKEKFDNYIISLNQLLSNKYLEEENKIRIEIFNNDDEIKSIVLNAEMHYFEISVWSDINNKKINFQSLSSGEQKLLLLFAKLNYVVSKDYIKNKKNYILLLDEPEVYIHPDWQKKLISNFINFIKKHKILKEKNVHLIITSHSPFILSDLPKENVIFLKNGKQVDVDIETFGANIHTLLSHGFFMENGLMGEFAKSEIDKVIELLNSEKNLSKKKLNFCKSIISIIGEPVLKSTLQNMLDEKMYSKETRLDKLRRKQKELEDEIKKEKQKAKPDEED